MKVSLILPAWNEEKTSGQVNSDLELRLSDLDSFFSRFPWDFELHIGLDPSQDNTETLLNAYQFKKLKLRLLKNKRHLGRAQTLRRLLLETQADGAVVFSFDLSSPLADVFSVLSEGLENQAPLLILGNSRGPKKRSYGERSSWHYHLEQMLLEKSKIRFKNVQDPLSSVFSLNKAALEKFQETAPQLKRWYFTPELLNWAEIQKISISEVEIQKRFKASSRIPVLKEWMMNFF